MDTDNTGNSKDPSSEKGKQSSNLPQASCNVKRWVMAIDDNGVPNDRYSEKLKQSTMLPQESCNFEIWLKAGQGISIYPCTFSSSINLNTCTQPQPPSNNIPNRGTKTLDEDLIQISEASSNQNNWKIFKVPHPLRLQNKKDYKPRVISIGPYNYGKKHLKAMEVIKERSLSRILRESNAKEFVTAMGAMEPEVRNCYTEDLRHIDSDTFVKMMIIDGCFIVDLFQNDLPSNEFWGQDPIRNDIYCDLLLLENQLPFSVLSRLYGMIKMSNVEMDEIAPSAQMDELARSAQMDEFARLALSRLKILVPGPVKYRQNVSENNKDIKHLLGLVYDSWIPPLESVQDQCTLPRSISCARKLKDAGIKFVKKDNDVGNDTDGQDENVVASFLLDINFTHAKLKIPALKIDKNTKLILQNFMAFEQSTLIGKPTYVCDYVEFMNNLIGSDNDVKLLRRSRVIDNLLANNEAVARMFKKLRDFTNTSEQSFCYTKIYDRVNKHCKGKWRAKKLKKVRCFIPIINWRQAGK